jgi:DNA-directed RNA polymerase specialized sigma24 family protein
VGLTDDQKAMLRLLAQREEGYDDMAALMGISVEEVRERV